MVIEVKLKGKSLLLSEWERAGKGSHNKLRRLIPSDNFSCVGLMCSWSNEARILINRRDGDVAYNNLPFEWAPMFLGPDLWYLKEPYYKMYPDPPKFNNFEIKEAQQHLDHFIDRFNSLKAFL